MQAPRGCSWHDVKGFYPHVFQSYSSFRNYIDLFVPSVPFQPASSPSPGYLVIAQEIFESSTRYRDGHDEGRIVPVVHFILHSAAYSLNKLFRVIAEPSVCPAIKDMLGDAAVLEAQCIVENEILRVLVVAKGSQVYPYDLRGDCTCKHVGQLFQQVALAYASGLWETTLLCGLVTSFQWNFFVVESASAKCSPIQIRIKEFSTFDIDPEKQEETVSVLMSFVMAYLDNFVK